MNSLATAEMISTSHPLQSSRSIFRSRLLFPMLVSAEMPSLTPTPNLSSPNACTFRTAATSCAVSAGAAKRSNPAGNASGAIVICVGTKIGVEMVLRLVACTQKWYRCASGKVLSPGAFSFGTT